MDVMCRWMWIISCVDYVDSCIGDGGDYDK